MVASFVFSISDAGISQVTIYSGSEEQLGTLLLKGNSVCYLEKGYSDSLKANNDNKVYVVPVTHFP
jgi:hypothetical protein